MAKFGDGGELLKCSFCGKSQKQVKKLIAGPGVYICDECIDLCNEIIEEELAESSELGLDELLAHHTGQEAEKIHKDTERDFVMSADEAREYGIIDEVITARSLADKTGPITRAS